MIKHRITHVTIYGDPNELEAKVTELFPEMKISKNHSKITLYPNKEFHGTKFIRLYRHYLMYKLNVPLINNITVEEVNPIQVVSDFILDLKGEKHEVIRLNELGKGKLFNVAKNMPTKYCDRKYQVIDTQENKSICKSYNGDLYPFNNSTLVVRV